MQYNQLPSTDTSDQYELAAEWEAVMQVSLDGQSSETLALGNEDEQNPAALEPIVFEAKDSNEILPDSIAARDAGIANLCSKIVPEGYQVVMPHTAIAAEDLTDHLQAYGLDAGTDQPVWIYGSVLPKELFERSTKVQVHEPFDKDEAPDWFDSNFPEYIKETTVPGYSCFSSATLEAASHRMLEEFNGVRLKNPNGSSGEEQLVIEDPEHVEAALTQLREEVERSYDMDFDDFLAKYGYVLEANLQDVTAWSVTVTHTPEGRYSSFGRLLESEVALPDGGVMKEYGGTSSVVVRGDPTQLATLPDEGLPVREPVLGDDALRLAPTPGIVQAAQRHIEGMRLWEADGIFRTRANVDVIEGVLERRDGTVEFVTASVEDSGRAGGASPAELQGIKALQDNPDLPFAVRSTRHCFNEDDAERYAEHTAHTTHGQIFWHGNDPTWEDKHVFLGVF